MKKIVPKISVIVSAYNQERFIGRCLRSLLNQTLTHSEYEIIVINDGSTDRTSYAIDLFVDPFNSVVKLIKNDFNLGLPASLNKALKVSQAKYVVRVDSDDFVNSNFLNFLYCYLEMNQIVDAVACDYLLIDDKERELKKCNCLEEPIACGIMFQKQHLFNIGLYDEQFLCKEEQDLMIRFKKKYNLDRLNLSLYRYRRHEGNMTNDRQMMEDHKKNLILKHGKDSIIE